MDFKTETQRRFAEVLDELNIKAEYQQENGVFVMDELKTVAFEGPVPAQIKEYYNCLQGMTLLQIHSDGSQTFEDGNQAKIIYCLKCKKFSFLRKDEKNCRLCGSDAFRLLSHYKIPGWFGKTEDSLIDESSRRAQNEDEHDKTEAILEHLRGKPKCISVDEKKIQAVKELGTRYPNMKDAVDYIVQQCVAATLKNNKEISIRPLLLVGSPGCGKTSFTRELCKILMGKEALKIDLGNEVANFTLTGTDTSFSKSKPGLIITSMFSDGDGHPLRNPFIHFDELDKVKSNGEHSVETAFYALLEKSNARSLYDNYIGMNVDASGVNYIFTANELKNIPAPIISRLKVIQISDYTQEQVKDIVIDNCYENWLKNNRMEREFLPAVLSDEIKERILALCGCDTRAMEDAIVQVFNETIAEDPKTKHKIALFSAEELYRGWENYRGARPISKERWTVPKNFCAQQREEKSFDPVEFIKSYNG